MPEAKKIEFRYFSAVEGHLVARYGTDLQIGATRGPKGWEINPDLIVAVPMDEVRNFVREYGDALRRGELVKRTQQEFDAQEAKVTELEGNAPPAPAEEVVEEPPTGKNDPLISAEQEKKREEEIKALREKALAGVEKLKASQPQPAPQQPEAPEPGEDQGTLVQGDLEEEDPR